MIVRCEGCAMYYDDQFRWTYCPHDTFAANDGRNRFAHHPLSYLSATPPTVGQAGSAGREHNPQGDSGPTDPTPGPVGR